MSHKVIYYKTWKSPVGDLNLYANDTSLLALTYQENDREVAKRLGLEQHSEEFSPVIDETIRQLGEYFEGKRKVFDLPIELTGTDFQKSAWAHLRKIPNGTIVSYRDQAKAINREKAVRAVGSANGKNPISIIVPCHRVMGANAKISGYAGTPIVKKKLLEIEGHRFLNDAKVADLGKEKSR